MNKTPTLRVITGRFWPHHQAAYLLYSALLACSGLGCDDDDTPPDARPRVDSGGDNGISDSGGVDSGVDSSLPDSGTDGNVRDSGPDAPIADSGPDALCDSGPEPSCAAGEYIGVPADGSASTNMAGKRPLALASARSPTSKAPLAMS